jgi:hypothetical protein
MAMTQADGILPTTVDIRLELRTIKPLLEALEASLTAAARVTDLTPTVRRYEVLAGVTAAYEALRVHIPHAEAALGLPYYEVIDGSCTAYFGPDDPVRPL